MKGKGEGKRKGRGGEGGEGWQAPLSQISGSAPVVVINLYFDIFAAFKESITLNLAHRLFKVIHFGGNQKPVYDFNHLI